MCYSSMPLLLMLFPTFLAPKCIIAGRRAACERAILAAPQKRSPPSFKDQVSLRRWLLRSALIRAVSRAPARALVASGGGGGDDGGQLGTNCVIHLVPACKPTIASSGMAPLRKPRAGAAPRRTHTQPCRA